MKHTFAALLLLCCTLLFSAGASPALAQTDAAADQSADTASAASAGEDSFGDALQPPPPPIVSADDQKAKIKNMAFQSALESAMPMTPDMVRQLIQRMTDLQRASSPPLGTPNRPKAVMKAETVSLSPGANPPVVKVSSGYVATIMILDATGAPWPVADLAYAGKFDVKVSQEGSHIIRIMPMLRFIEGNLSLQLRGLAAPVTLKLVSGTDEIYYRYDLRVPAIGPGATPPAIDGATRIAAGDATIMSVLDGYPPQGAKRLKVTGVDDRTAAWDVDGQIYLRTPHNLLSPAWTASVKSGDGTTVYSIPDTPVLLLSDQGMMVRARLTQPEGTTGSGDMLDDNGF